MTITVEHLVWTWIYMGIAAGIISVGILIWAIIHENKDKK